MSDLCDVAETEEDTKQRINQQDETLFQQAWHRQLTENNHYHERDETNLFTTHDYNTTSAVHAIDVC